MEQRAAGKNDLDAIWPLIQQAKERLKHNGVNQWQDGYPGMKNIRADIQQGVGHVLTDCGRVIGYACISFDGEPCYDAILGSWKSLQPYAVIHRIAVEDGYRGSGLAYRLFEYAEELCRARGVHSIKIDTDEDNATMRHILGKCGYEYCGVVEFEKSQKIAFEKLLPF